VLKVLLVDLTLLVYLTLLGNPQLDS